MALSRVDAGAPSSHISGASAARHVAPLATHAPVRLVLAVPRVASPAPPAAAAAAAAPTAPDATLPAPAPAHAQFELLECLPDEAITDLRLRMAHRAGFARDPATRCLVFGELDARLRAGLLRASPPGAAGADWLHVFAPAAAVESVELRTPHRELAFDNAAPAGGAAGAPAPAAPPAANAAGEAALPLVLAAPRGGASPAAAAGGAGTAAPAVVHVLVHKSARVAWRAAAGGAYELDVLAPRDSDDGSAAGRHQRAVTAVASGSTAVDAAADASAAPVAAATTAAAAAAAPPADGLAALLAGGGALRVSRPLADYCSRPGAPALRLIPIEPSASAPASASPSPFVAAAVTAPLALTADAAASSDDDESDAGSGSAPASPGGSPPRGGGGADTLPDGSPRLESPLHALHSGLQRARQGLARGRAPKLAAAGTGGAYFLSDAAGGLAAVFKPADEEPLAPSNPKGWRAPAASSGGGAAAAAALGSIVGGGGASAAAAPGEGLRRGLRPGEGAVREVAASVLDWGGFSGVPPTALVALELGDDAAAGDAAGDAKAAAKAAGDAKAAAAAPAKLGSLQQFVAADGDAEEVSARGAPARELHKIAVLDLRLGNTDRNASNILVKRPSSSGGRASDGGDGSGGWELIPIDHGSVLPDSFEDISFEWAWWPQAEVPFDAETLDYIAALDADRDAAALAAHGLPVRAACVRVLRVCTALLRGGAAAGLTAARLAALASRMGDGPSPLERAHAAALAACGLGGLAASGAAAALDADAALEGRYLGRMRALVDEMVEDARLDDVAGLGV